MERWILASTLTIACALTAPAVAQTPEELKRDLEALKAKVDRQSEVIADQAKKLAAFEDGRLEADRDAAVETEINRLSERMAKATTVRSGAERLSFAGEFRFRSYWEYGENAADVERDGTWTSAKIRFGILYEFTKNVAAYLDLQSTFAFGHNGHSNAAAPANFDPGEPIHACQAWLEVQNVLGVKELSSKVGRQSVTLGNQFQFGNADWYNGYFFDGARYDWNGEDFTITAMWLRTATTGPNDGNQFPAYGPFGSAFSPDGHDHDEYYVAYFTLKSLKDMTLDLYWIYANQHAGITLNSLGGTTGGLSGNPAAPAYFHTLGARFAGDVDVAAGLDWNVEVAYQTGSVDAVPGDFDVSALAIEAELGVTFDEDSKFRAWIRGLFAEGPDGNDTGYLPIAPNRHSNTAAFRARYGQMDVMPMTDAFILTGGVHVDPWECWTFGLTGTWGQSDTDQGAGIDDSYGFEVDAWGEYRYSDALTFSGGLSILFPDDLLDGTVAGPSTFDDDPQFLLWAQARLFF